MGCGMMGGGSYLRNKGQISLDITTRLTKRSHPFSFLSVCLPGKSEKNVQAQISHPVCLVTHVLVHKRFAASLGLQSNKLQYEWQIIIRYLDLQWTLNGRFII